jgi:hypothetical protein
MILFGSFFESANSRENTNNNNFTKNLKITNLKEKKKLLVMNKFFKIILIVPTLNP